MTNRSSRKATPLLRIAIAIQLFAILTVCTFDAAARADSTDAASFAAVGAASEIKGAPGVYEWTYQATVGKSPFDKIGLHRTAKGPNPPVHPDAVVLYLPGTNMNGEVALEDPRDSF